MDVWRHSKLIIIPVTFLGLPFLYTLTLGRVLYLWTELWSLAFVPVGRVMAPGICTCEHADWGALFTKKMGDSLGAGIK